MVTDLRSSLTEMFSFNILFQNLLHQLYASLLLEYLVDESLKHHEQ